MAAGAIRRAPAAIAGLVLLLVVVATTTHDTAGGFAARVANTASQAGSGTLQYTHTYGATTCSSKPATGGIPSTSSFPCTGGLAPASVPATGTASSTDAIASSGTVPANKVTDTVAASSCGPVQLANRVVAADPLLPRYATTFSPTVGPMAGSGSVTLDGSTASAVSVSPTTQPTPLLGATYAIGVAFKTTSTAGGALLSFSDSPINGTSGNNDRILYLDKAGHIGFGYNTSGGTTGVSTASYNDGNWHFAYVTISLLVGGLLTSISVYVDGSSTAAVSAVGIFSIGAYSGYWHLGWGPLTKYSYGSGLSNYFAGSLSNFVVLNGGSPPATLGLAASQTAFNSSLGSSLTEHWLLNDSGTTTFGGPYPVIGSTSPCSMVTFSWGFTNPTSCAWSPASTTAACNTAAPSTLSAFVAAGSQTIASAAPGTTQTGTITVGRASTYNTGFVPGLRLYAPLTFKATSGGWSDTFTWSSAAAAIVA